MSIRRTALNIFSIVVSREKYSNLALKEMLLDTMPRNERAFITALVYGTLEKLITIDYILSMYTKGRVQTPIKNILRMGVYQLKYMDNTPIHAICDESVKLTKEIGKGALTGYVNGVLRNIARSGEVIYPPIDENIALHLSTKYSYPLLVVKDLLHAYGQETTINILSYSLPKATCIRVNYNTIDKEEFIQILEQNKIKYSSGIYFDNAFYINGNEIYDLDIYKYGDITVQSEASMLICALCGDISNSTFFDVCAAPGGKSIYLAQAYPNAQITSADIHPHRVELIKSYATRCNTNNITAIINDATVYNEEIGLFDYVLCDVPCSGLGVIDTKPDILLDIDKNSCENIQNLQINILNNSSKYCKINGILVYSTCTIRAEENLFIINEFLQNNNSFRLESIEELLPNSLECETAKNGYVQTLPHKHKINGFFGARLRRIH